MDEVKLNELIEEKNRIRDAIESIDHQIALAKADSVNGIYSDPQWFARANYALKKHRRRDQELMRKIGELRKMAKRNNAKTVERIFMEEAKRRLDNELYAEILNEAFEIFHGNELQQVTDSFDSLRSSQQRVQAAFEHMK